MMGWDIFIGNAEPRFNPADEHGPGSFQWVVERVNREDAPTFPNDEVTGNGNGRHPSYSAWNGTLRRAGLTELFFDNYTGLMGHHPGIFHILPAHVEAVEAALSRFKEKHPRARPRFGGGPPKQFAPNMVMISDDMGEGASEEDAMLARLEWLAWWMRWAVENCERPAIYNH